MSRIGVDWLGGSKHCSVQGSAAADYPRVQLAADYLGRGTLHQVDSSVGLPQFVVTAAAIGEDLHPIQSHINVGTKQMISFYIAQYPVLRIIQSTLHFTSMTELFTQTPHSLGSIQPYATINARRLRVHISTTVYCQIPIYTAE